MKKECVKKFFRRLGRIFLWLFIAQLIYIIALRWLNPPITVTEIVSLVRGHGLHRQNISYNESAADMKLAVMASEDQLFPDHNGFDIKEIRLAVTYNKKHPHKVRGASTISQQVAKNVFLWQGGGYFRKALEVYFTFMIEKLWNKKRILEVYLNVAQTGPGIFGAEAAAQKYFGHSAARLTRQKAAEIAACLPNPAKFSVVPLSAYVARRAPAIEDQMANIEDDEAVHALINK